MSQRVLGGLMEITFLLCPGGIAPSLGMESHYEYTEISPFLLHLDTVWVTRSETLKRNKNKDTGIERYYTNVHLSYHYLLQSIQYRSNSCQYLQLMFFFHLLTAEIQCAKTQRAEMVASRFWFNVPFSLRSFFFFFRPRLNDSKCSHCLFPSSYRFSAA